MTAADLIPPMVLCTVMFSVILMLVGLAINATLMRIATAIEERNRRRG